jgi:hypothetical protein
MMAYPQNTKSLAERAIIIHGLEKNDVASAIAQGRELQEAFDAPQNSEGKALFDWASCISKNTFPDSFHE